MMDIAILAFNTNGGSFEARVEGDQYSFKPYEQVHSFQQDLLERFVHRWHDPGRTYFVYGGHGMGDYMDLEQGVTSLPVHQLASILGSRTFEGMVFDSCFMSNLDCAYHLRHHTKYIGACEGYMWEPDHIPSRHIFNHRTAALMCNGGSSSNETERGDDSTVGLGRGRPGPLRVLEQVQRRYCRQSPFADFSILDTTHVEDLRKFVHRYVIPRVYDRLTFYNPEQLKRLEEMGARSLQLCESLYHWNGSAASAENGGKLLQRVGVTPPLDIPKGTAALLGRSPAATETGSVRGQGSGTGMNGKPLPRTSLSSPSSSLLSSHSRFRAEDRAVLMESVQLEHSLYPFNLDDKHLIDLKSYLIDMANEEAIERHGGNRSTRLCNPSAYSWWRNKVGSPSSGGKDGVSVRGSGGAGGRMPPMASRTHNVHLHGTAFSGASLLWSSSSTAAPHSPSSSASLILEGSGRQGLQLLDQVVVKQQGPRAKPLYASRLGGISFTVHEFSPHSKPLVPWVLPAEKVSALKAKMKRFLKSGRLEEVHLPELPDAGVQEGKVRCISPRKKKKEATSVKVSPLPSPSSTSLGGSSRRKCGAVRDGGGTIKGPSGKCTKDEKRPTGVVKLQKPTPKVSVEKDMPSLLPLPSASNLPFSSFSSSTPIQVVPTSHLSSSSSLLSFPREKVNVFQCR